MIYTPQKVLKALQQKKYAPVYFLQGEEPYSIHLITNYIEKNVLNAAEKALNLSVVYGKDVSMQEILTHARRFPMGSAYQIVLVKEAQELQDLKKEIGRRLLAAYVQSPQPSTLLVFAHKHKILNARSSLSKVLSQQAVLVHAKQVYDSQIPEWITGYIQAKGLTITAKAILLLQQYIGNDLTMLVSELDKLQLNLKEKTEIDEAIVQAYVGISKAYHAFELQKALAQKDVHKTYQIVAYFVANPKNHPAIPLVALLFSFFSKLLCMHHSPDKSALSLAQRLSIHPYFLEEYRLAVQHYPLAKVIENMHHLHQADLQLKGIDYPATPEGQILKELIFKLMH